MNASKYKKTGPEAHYKAMKDSGLADEREMEDKPTLRFHDLRHTFGTQLAASSRDLNLVKEAMRHADISTTERYAHVIEDSHRFEIERLSDIIFSGKNEDLRERYVSIADLRRKTDEKYSLKYRKKIVE